MTAGGFDGSVRINTKIDTSGINAGLAKISVSMKGLFRAITSPLLSVAATGMQIVGVFALISGALIGAAGAAMVLGVRIFKMLEDSISKTSAYYDTIQQIQGAFNTLKGAFLSAFGTLLTAALPAIMTVVNWLTKMLNLIAQIIAALTGQATVMQYVAGSAEAAAKATGQSAKNTEKQAKAAKGALAAFDQINVLEQKQEDAGAAGGGAGVGGSGGGGPMQFEAAPISGKAMEWAEKIRTAWELVKAKALEVWNWLTGAWGKLSDFFRPIIDWLVERWTKTWNINKEVALAVWNFLVGVWESFRAWFEINVIAPVSEKISWLVGIFKDCAKRMYDGFIKPLTGWFMTTLWPIIQSVIAWIGEKIGGFIENVKAGFKIGFETVVSIVKNVWTAITGIITGIITTIGGIVQFITGVFTGDWKLAWEGVKNIFKGIFEGISAIVKGVVNTIIDLINGMLKVIVIGINTLIKSLNSFKVKVPDFKMIFGDMAGKTWGLSIPTVTAPQIPRLATGAVIPPNAEFLAVMGDQRHGNNLEGPESMFRRIVSEVVNGALENLEIKTRIEFAGTLGQLVRELKPYIDRENNRVGPSLISRGNI